MSARSSSGTLSRARGDGLGSPLDSLRRSVLRLPLASQAAIAVAFVCSYLAYGRIAGHARPIDWRLLAGLVSFLLLFFQLRLIDDLDDIDRDHLVGRWGASRRAALEARLVMGLVGCISTVAMLNIASFGGLLAAGVATLLAFAGPFGFKRLFPTRLAFGSILFEAAPLSIFVYVYFFWRDNGGAALQTAAPACVAGLLWTGYEFWKFSRKVHTDELQPYFLRAREIRFALNVLLSLAMVANVGLALAANLSIVYAAYAAALPVGFMAWVNGSWPRSAQAKARAQAARPLWSGLTFVGALEAGLLIELLHSTLR